MTQELYVYIPGFKYDSKGPLHIDAIRLDVTVGEIEKDAEGHITNSLETYCFLDLDLKRKILESSIKGNLIYRAIDTKLSIIKSRYIDKTTAPEDAMATKDSKRVLNGFFYDYVTIEEDKTHHIIGTLSTKDDNIITRNLDADLHDGLFVVKVNELNTDLVLTFTFYSRIDDSTQSNKVGKLEKKLTTDIVDNNMFILENVPDFFDKYIEVGKWVLTYNPATSGVVASPFILEEFVQQYYNLKEWGNDEFQEWQIPVNADFLVTDMSKDSNKKTDLTGGSVWKLYIYDSNEKKHILGNTLKCNTLTNVSYGKYYSDFYLIKLEYRGSYEDLVINAHYKGVKTLYWEQSHNKWDNIVGVYCFDYLNSFDTTFNYKCSYMELSSFGYLYNNKPKIKLYNLVKDENFGNPSSDYIGAFIMSDTINRSQSNFLNCIITDHSNIIRYPGSGQYERFYYWSNDIDGVTSFANNDSKNNFGSIKIESIYNGNTQSTLPYLTFSFSENNLPSTLKDKNSSIGDTINQYYKERYEVIKDIGVPSFWYNKLLDDVSSSLLSPNSFDIDISSEVKIHLSLNNIKIPLVAYGVSSGEGSWTNDWNSIKNRTNNVSDTKTLQNYLRDPYSKITLFNGLITLSQQNLPNFFKEYYDNGKYKLGKTTIVLPQMYQINLPESNITYSNKSDKSICPAIYNDTNGYSEKSLLNVNVIDVNLLDTNPDETNTFEIERIIKLEYIKDPFNIKFKLGASDKYDSSFCYDKRFIELNNINYLQDISITLNPGLYIINIPSNFPNCVTDIKLKINSNTQTVSTNKEGNLVLKIKNSVTFKIISILTKNAYVYLGLPLYYISNGIGLYKVDLDKTDTNTLVLKKLYEDTYVTSDYMIIDTTSDMYKRIILPAAFCAKENITFGLKKRTRNYNASYGNDYNENGLKHYYNFKYLPKKAIYKIAGYYQIPAKVNRLANLSNPDTYIELFNQDINPDIIKNTIIRT